MKKFKKILFIVLWFIWATYIVIVGNYVILSDLSEYNIAASKRDHSDGR